jgi:hypothetical protein
MGVGKEFDPMWNDLPRGTERPVREEQKVFGCKHLRVNPMETELHTVTVE